MLRRSSYLAVQRHDRPPFNAENMLGTDNAVNIFKIKLIATLDQKMELVTKRREELRTTKSKAEDKATKMNALGGDVATAST